MCSRVRDVDDNAEKHGDIRRFDGRLQLLHKQRQSCHVATLRPTERDDDLRPFRHGSVTGYELET